MNVVSFIKDQEKKLRANFFRSNLSFAREPQLSGLPSAVSERLAWILSSNCVAESVPAKPVEIHNNVGTPDEVYAKWSSRIGSEIYVGDWYTVTQRCINQFAEATGDSQWIHVDARRAAEESPFGVTIAHGFLTLSLIPRLTNFASAEQSLFPEARIVMNYGLNSVRFTGPVKCDSQLRARIKLMSMEPSRRHLKVLNEVVIEVNGSCATVCVAETLLLLKF